MIIFFGLHTQSHRRQPLTGVCLRADTNNCWSTQEKGDIQAPMWIHFYDIRTISPKTLSLELEKNYAIKNSQNDLQLPPGSKNMHFFQTNGVKKIVIIKMI